MVQQQWSTEQWAMQTFKKHKMGHVSENIENHCSKTNASNKWFYLEKIALAL